MEAFLWSSSFCQESYPSINWPSRSTIELCLEFFHNVIKWHWFIPLWNTSGEALLRPGAADDEEQIDFEPQQLTKYAKNANIAGSLRRLVGTTHRESRNACSASVRTGSTHQNDAKLTTLLFGPKPIRTISFFCNCLALVTAAEIFF